MKTMKRLLSILLCMVLVLAAVPAAGATGTVRGKPKISISTVSAAPGDTVALSVELAENPGLMCMIFEVRYDRDRLSLVGITGVGLVGWDSNGDKILWLGDKNSSFNGTIVELNFRVHDDAEPGDGNVTLSCREGDVADHDETAYVPMITSGKVVVEGAYTGIEVPAQPTYPVPFKDVPENSYYYTAVGWAYKNGVTNGRSEDVFDPAGTCKRCEAVTFLWRAAGSPEPKTDKNPFTDVKTTDYFYKPVLWAVEQGITLGTDATHFTPYQTCSTAHIITFIYRALGVGTDGWYRVAGDWANGQGLLKDTKLMVDPSESCPRSAVVTFLYRWSLKRQG